jgi:hypothetical protein
MGMNKLMLATLLALSLGQVHAQGAKEPLPASTPIEALKPGEWLWYADAVPEGPMLLMVSITQQKAFLYRNGIRVGASTISTGRKGYETPTGVFTILQKHIDHRSNLYDDAPMPYMQRLTWSGVALHAGNLPGYPASHGCVRMPEGFAKRLFAETELGMTVIVSKDGVSRPENLASPDVFAQSMDSKGRVVEVPPLSNFEAFRWQPEKSLFGPVSVLISTKNQLVIALRNGIEIGRAKIGVLGSEPFGSQAYVVLEGEGREMSRIVPDRRELNWMQVNVSGGAAEPKAGLDASAMQRVVLPAEFARLLYPVLYPGSSLLLTDEDINLEGTSKGMTVLTDEPDEEHDLEQ